MKLTIEDKIQAELDNTDEACEAANYHNLCGLAEKLYKSTKALVPEKKRLQLAKQIAEAIDSVL